MRADNGKRRVVFLGTHGQHNIGDELLLETFLEQLGPDFHYTINTYDPTSTKSQLEGRYDFDVIDTAGDRIKLARRLIRADRVVFGGGSIIKELYATTGRHKHATLLMILAVVVFARRVARRPVAMFNIGVGPLETPLGRRLARLILRQIDVVTVRDPGSLAQCRSLGIEDTRVHLAADAAFSLTPDGLLGQAALRPRRPSEPLRVGLNLNYDIENPDNWDHFTAHLARALRGLNASRTIEIHALPMQSRSKEHDDATMLRSLAGTIPEVRFVHHEPATSEDAARIIAECDLVIGERFHAIVMASLLGVPSFVLAYDVKVRELSTMLGLERYTVDINTPFAVADLEEPLRRLVDDLDGVQTRVAPRVGELHRRTRDCFARARSWMIGTPPSC